MKARRIALTRVAIINHDQMNRLKHETPITLSVLDRLVDEKRKPWQEPEDARAASRGLSLEPPDERANPLEQLKQAVSRDLGWLLNTRQTPGASSPEFEHLPQSLAAYGLPDFSSKTLKSEEDRRQVQRDLETAISVFEPRLEDVTVTLLDAGSFEQKLRFRIDARLRVNASREPVSFDTVLQAGNKQYVVKAE